MKVYAFAALAFVAVFGVAFAANKISTSSAKLQQFNYETADRPERSAFLTVEAAAMRASIEPSLNKLMELEAPLINPEARQITFRILVEKKAAAKLTARSNRMSRYRSLCPGYMTSALSKNSVKVVQKFVAINGTGALMRITLSKKICGQVL